jgi:DNA-binding CsgD family transcriptional regulator
MGLGDASGARQFIRDTGAVLRQRPGLGMRGKRRHEKRLRLGTLQAAGATGSTLTSAELRLLPLLVTHLTLAGIADRVFLSRHTVKAQVWSMYRKLGVHTRGDAVVRRGSWACSRSDPVASPAVPTTGTRSRGRSPFHPDCLMWPLRGRPKLATRARSARHRATEPVRKASD